MAVRGKAKAKADPALAGTTFSEEVPEEHFGLNLNLRGPEKCGRTYLCLATAPEPVAYLNGDRDNSRLIRQMRRQGRKLQVADSYIYSLPGPARVTKKLSTDAARLEQRAINQANAAVVRPIWDRFRSELEAACKSQARSIVIDTGTWAYQASRLAVYGTLSIPPWQAPEYKAAFQSVLHIPDEYGKVVIWIHRWSDEYEDVKDPVSGKLMFDANGEKLSARTGRMKTDGFNQLDYVMDATVEMEYDLETNPPGRKATIMRGIGGVGKVFEGEKLSIPEMCAAVTRTKASEWV